MFDTAYAHIVKLCAGCGGSISLINQYHGQAKTSFEAACKALAGISQFMLAAIRVGWHAHHQQHRVPFFDQGCDSGKALLRDNLGNGCQRVNRAQFNLAHCHTDTLQTEIEAQHRPAMREVRGEG